MPLYEYQCDACGHRFEAIQKFSDSPIETCPKCAGTVHKLQSAPAFQFKGTGWYITDYAKKDSSAGAAGGGEGSKDGKSEGGASAASTDAKSTEKSDKSDKPDKSDKAGKPGKTDKPSAAASTSSTKD